MATEAVRVAQNIRQITIAPLLAEAILRISDEIGFEPVRLGV